MISKKYDMNLMSLISLGIGSIFGAGIFALLGQVVLQAGDKTYWTFIIAGIAALFSGYSYAKLAAVYPHSGGLSDYFHAAFKNKWISGSLTLIYMLTSAITISMMAKSFGIYAAKYFTAVPDHGQMVNVYASILIIGLALLNMMGATDVGWTEILLVAIKFIILSALATAALWNFDFGVQTHSAHPTVIGFLGTIGITFFAFAGYGVITNAAADVKNPQTTIRRGIFLTLIIVTILYLLLAFVILNYIPEEELHQNADIAVAVAAKKLLGAWGYELMYVAAVFAFISGINATFFSIFRISRSLGEQKILPHFYVQKFWRHGTFGNLLTSTLILLATLYFNFSAIVNLASAAYLVSYLGVFAANWQLRRETKSSAALILIGAALMIFILIAFIISIVS